MRKVVLTVTLNPALDRTVIVDDFNLGKEHCLGKEYLSAGGKGLNVARALKIFGVPVLATGILGGNEGKTIEQLLKDENIPSDFYHILNSTRTNLTVISQKSRQQTRILSPGPRVSSKDLASFTKKYSKLLSKSSLVVLSGRNANGALDTYYADLIRLARRKDVPCVLDTSGKSLMNGIKARPVMVKPNVEETEAILHQKLKTNAQIQSAISKLHRLGAEIVFISTGKTGAIGSNQKEIFRVVPPEVSAYNDVGCGDAFIAAAVYAYLSGESFKNIVKFAVSAATASAMSIKPAEIDLREQKSIFKKVRISQVY
ncbi:MAG: 1-phosphofructokinase family hexose kinase [Candidatus Omnitrophica bacterium]|nr:1-phosphofructokinase family hexose kinase [Candidatus Omnitrophota bacterium]